jgi:hypothetical protein
MKEVSWKQLAFFFWLLATGYWLLEDFISAICRNDFSVHLTM